MNGFLLHSIMEDDKVKVMQDVLEQRNELLRRRIIFLRRESKEWSSMLIEDSVLLNSLLNQMIKPYNVMIERKIFH